MNHHSIQHPLHGHGQIVELRRSGRMAVVDFDDLPLPTLVPIRELEDFSPRPDNEPEPTPHPAPKAHATRPLESMRLGVVPAADVATFTVARDREIASFDDTLDTVDAGGAGLQLLLGDYGTGKTHLLQLFSHRARRKGFLTARVTLDARECRPSHPRRIYRALIHQLRYPDHDGAPGLGPLFERALLSEDVGRHFADNESFHLYLSPTLQALRALSKPDAEELVDVAETRRAILNWIEGHRDVSNGQLNKRLSVLPGSLPWLYSLKDYRPWARIYTYILTGIAALARLSGYAGLFLFVDEAERFELLSNQNRAFALTFFRALARATCANELAPHPMDDRVGDGGHGVLKTLPAAYDDGKYMGAAIAITPSPNALDTGLDLVPEHSIVNLPTPSPEDYGDLARRVTHFYTDACTQPPLEHDRIESLVELIERLTRRNQLLNARQVMKTVVEILDVHRHYPDRAPGVLRNIDRVADL